MFGRADNYSFVRIGIPIADFIFGYDRNNPEEAASRDWYARRLHKPQHDLIAPIDFPAAAMFNAFFTALALAVANAPVRPNGPPPSPTPQPPRGHEATLQMKPFPLLIHQPSLIPIRSGCTHHATSIYFAYSPKAFSGGNSPRTLQI